MSELIKIDITSNIDNKTISDIHVLPCKISFNGEDDVESYFKTSIQTTDSNVLTNSFRGRPLNGVLVDLPKDQIGLVLESKDESNYETRNTFEKIYSWQLDEPKLSLETDQLAKSIYDWYQVSEIIHS